MVLAGVALKWSKGSIAGQEKPVLLLRKDDAVIFNFASLFYDESVLNPYPTLSPVYAKANDPRNWNVCTSSVPHTK